MWITTVNGFVSVVEDRDDADILQVRARARADITAMFPTAEVYDLPGADYLHRARVPRQQVADALHAAVMAIDYDSHFKDVALETSPPNDWRYDAYYDTWSAMAQMQDVAPYSTQPRTSSRRFWEDKL